MPRTCRMIETRDSGVSGPSVAVSSATWLPAGLDMEDLYPVHRESTRVLARTLGLDGAFVGPVPWGAECIQDREERPHDHQC